VSNIEDILGTMIEPDESWKSVFARVDAMGGLDVKTLTKVIIYILERLDENERHRKDTGDYVTKSYGSVTDFGGTDDPIQEGIGGVDEEVQPDPKDTGTDSDNGTQEPEPVVV
jgi:hypothetical protein